MKKLRMVIAILFSSVLLVGCPIGPHSRLYKPLSEMETYAFSRANRDIYPNDVRENFSLHDSSRVAWPGILRAVRPKQTDSTLEVHLLVEHHYWDWIEDFSIQKEHIFLSPRGEGKFEAVWHLKPDTDSVLVAKSVGNMLIVYGIPESVTDSTIVLRAFYVREIGHEWFATDIWTYGRNMEDFKVLRIP